MAKRKNGKDVLKKLIPMLIGPPPKTKAYHTNYQRLNRHLDKEMKHPNTSMRKLEIQAETLFNDMEKILRKKRALIK